MSQINTTYSNSYSSGTSYSAGIWQGTNAVFPSIPGGTLPGDRAAMPADPGAGAGAPVPGKKPGFKLRKSIQPKQPQTILYELAGGAKPQFDFYDVPFEERERRAWQMDCNLDDVGCYECRCTVQGMEFIGEGATKNDARENVVEIAIQGMVSMKCDMNDSAEGIGTNEDNCPWPQLASLALYKMYNDWQTQGYVLPKELTGAGADNEVTSSKDRRSGNRNNSNTVPLGSRPEVDKPALQLLNEMASKMKLTLMFDCVSEVGMQHNKVFTFEVKIGEKKYCGQAKNKKEAKQAAAQAAVNDKDSWYNPPVRQPQPPGDGADAGDDEDHDMSEDNAVPPRKKRQAMDPEMKKLYFGDDREDKSSANQPKIVFKEPTDKGSQPGSHPSNI